MMRRRKWREGEERRRGEARGRRGGKPAVQHCLNYSSTSERVAADGETEGKTKREAQREEEEEEMMSREGEEEIEEEEEEVLGDGKRGKEDEEER